MEKKDKSGKLLVGRLEVLRISKSLFRGLCITQRAPDPLLERDFYIWEKN